jgi:hypothetical protein
MMIRKRFMDDMKPKYANEILSSYDKIMKTI